MGAVRELKFESPSFIKRLRGMLGVDFYRLFHTPLFYIFLAIAAIIPAMILGTGGMENPQTGQVSAQLYTNVWHIIAAESPLYVVNTIGEYANMNMVFIFGGIMVSIFIGHDYSCQKTGLYDFQVTGMCFCHGLYVYHLSVRFCGSRFSDRTLLGGKYFLSDSCNFK